jgi:hypothetical protein
MFDFGAADLAETDAQKTFRSHANYLRAFATMISDRPSQLIALRRTAARVAAFPVPKSSPIHQAELRGCLNRAWGTEMLLATGHRIASEDELLRLINSWGVVQAYYAASSATQALIVAEGRSRPTSHQQTQRQALDLWVTRSGNVKPWSFAMGSPAAPSTERDGSINGPGRTVVDVHPWSACTVDSCWDLAAVALRSTRKDALEHSLRKRRKTKRVEQRKAWATEEADRVSRGLKPRGSVRGFV